MEETCNKMISLLLEQNKTISMMESCTGGGVANFITNREGVSKAFQFGAVTYANEFKIKLGVSEKTIDTFSVYSMEVAKEMAFHIARISGSSYGIGITGKLNCEDENNPYGSDRLVYIAVYDSQLQKYTSFTVVANFDSREKNKELVIEQVFITMCSLLER